jgi:hypothetical protein
MSFHGCSATTSLPVAALPIDFAAVEGEGGAGADAGLDHGVLLPVERAGGHAAAAQQPRPPTHQARRHAEGRHQPQPHGDEAEQWPQHQAQHHRSRRHLTPPRWRRLPGECRLHRWLLVVTMITHSRHPASCFPLSLSLPPVLPRSPLVSPLASPCMSFFRQRLAMKVFLSFLCNKYAVFLKKN